MEKVCDLRGVPVADISALKQARRILRCCWDVYKFHTSCFSFSSLYVSTEQEERRRPQTGQKDSVEFLYIPAISDDPTLLPYKKKV